MKIPSGTGTQTQTSAKARLLFLQRGFYKVTFKAFSTLSFFISLQNYGKTLFVVLVIYIPEKLSEIIVVYYDKKNYYIVI